MRRVPLVVASLLLAVAAVVAQNLGGQMNRQYKRAHQDMLRLIRDGEAGRAVAQLTETVEAYPEDAESFYMLAVGHCKLGQLEAAVSAMDRAMELGMPGARFAGGRLTGLDPLTIHAAWREVRGEYDHRPISGPMLGCMTSSGVQIWLRTADEADVQILAAVSKDFTDPIRSKVARTKSEDDFTACIELGDLKPATHYYYHLIIGGTRDTSGATYSFRTAPKEGSPLKFRFAFGGGAGYVPENERMWDTVRSFEPDALVMLGDNVYIDDPTSPEMQHYCYYRRQARPEWRRLVSTRPVYSIWDDHDFGLNDCHGGPIVDDPKWKPDVLHVFRNNWVNPGYGQKDNPGCYYDLRVGDIHFIMLDGRYYRTPMATDKHPQSMLGETQERWLMDRVLKSDATFKVLCSPVPWTFVAKTDSPDTWNGYREQRDRIFSNLARAKVSGVVLLSADRHRSDLWRIDRPEGYALWELNSSRFTNQHVHETMSHAEFSYNAKQSFGLVDFDTVSADPAVHYRIISIDGEEVFDWSKKLGDLMD